MWSPFHTRARLERDLAVERVHRAHAERDNLELRARLAKTEAEFANLRDAVLNKQGVIHQPLSPAALTSGTLPSPIARVVAAFGRQEITSAVGRPDPETAMHDG